MTKIIVELCQNHIGERKILQKMIEEATHNGADIIKMQSIFSEDLAYREKFELGETPPDGTVKTIKRPYAKEKERLAKLDLTLEDHEFFIDTCKKFGVTPMTTIFARHRIKTIAQLPWPKKIVKVASYDCASFPFLKELAQYFDHCIVSTGSTYDEEIDTAVNILKNRKKHITLLHCVTSYPNTLDMCNLNRMIWLKKFTPEVGWSDHTLVTRDGIKASKVAIWLGADYVERHFTILKHDKTKDGPISITPELLQELNEFRKLSHMEQEKIIKNEIPNYEILLGQADRTITHTEFLNRDYYRGRFASPKQDGGWRYNWEEE